MLQSQPPQTGTTPGPAAPDAAANPTLRQRVYEILEGVRDDDPVADALDMFLVVLILANVAAFAAETVPSLQHQHAVWFNAFEAFSVGVFTLEYLLRIWTAVEVPFLKRLPAWQARLSWARRPYLIIDLLAILPFYAHHMLGVDLRVVRVLRLLRFLKLSRYSPAMHTLVRVLYNERRALSGAGLLLFAAVTFAATGIYYLENHAQPDKFGSVPESAWWAIATLTTVGYGDVTPITPLGKLFGAFVMIAGLCILALPVAIISTGFSQEVGRRDFVVTWSLMSRIPMLAELDASQVAEIMPLFHAHNLPPKVEVIERGSKGAAMYFIASGKVDMAADDFTHNYGTGDFFGVVAMLENDVNHGSFRTVTQCRVLKLYREDFRRLEHVNPEVTKHIRTVALARMRAREGQPSAVATPAPAGQPSTGPE